MRSYPLLLTAVALFGLVLGEDVFGTRLTTESSKTNKNMQYRFHYFVKDDTTGDFKRQEEIKEGDSVHGSYTLAEPNGDLRTVTYEAGPGKGFEAKVDIYPNASPIKQTKTQTPIEKSRLITGGETTTSAKNDKATTFESKIKRFLGGFSVDVSSKPRPDVKTEMGMKFSVKATPVTVPVTRSSTTVRSEKKEKMEEADSSSEVGQTSTDESTPDGAEISGAENFSGADSPRKETNGDPIEKEIDQLINSMPKLPELVLPDNETHLKFYKDPEEALLDERITEIARQLAEISRRKQIYSNELKIGTFLPKELTPGLQMKSINLSKPFKSTKNDLSTTTSPAPLLPTITQSGSVPGYIYKDALHARISPINYRLPVLSKAKTLGGAQSTEVMTNPLSVEIGKLETESQKDKELKYSTTPETSHTQSAPVVPAFFKLYSPYVTNTPGSYITPNKAESQVNANKVKKNFKTKEIPANYDTTISSYATGANEEITEISQKYI